MNELVANGPLVCNGCGDSIKEDSHCLSEMPWQVHHLQDVRMDTFRHFHAGSTSHDSSGSCYERYASSRPVTIMARKGADCTFCGHALSEGQRAVLDSFFVLNLEGKTGHTMETGLGLAGVRKVCMPKTASFRELSWSTKWKLMTAGLGKDRGLRSHAEAEQFYYSSIPAQVRSQGEPTVLTFLKGKQASHVESVANAPAKAKAPGNIIWESSKANARRGSRNMSRLERLRANAVNGSHSAGTVAKAAASSAARGALFAAILEAPVSALENTVHVAKGRKSRGNGARDTAKDIGKAGVAGAVVAGGVTVAATLGAGTAIAAAAPVVVPLGLGLYGCSAARRVRRAMTEEILASIQLQFHVQCAECELGQQGTSCYAAFASALSCDEDDRLAVLVR